jgi:hypothetical protein
MKNWMNSIEISDSRALGEQNSGIGFLKPITPLNKSHCEFFLQYTLFCKWGEMSSSTN